MTYALPGSNAAETLLLLKIVCEVPSPNAEPITIEVAFVIEEIVAIRKGTIESALEIVYDESLASGRSLEYAEGLMKRGRFSKLLGKVLRTSDKLIILGNDAVSVSPSLKQFMIKKIKTIAVAEGDDFFCNKCGTKQSESDSRFCSKCGNPLQPPIESKS